MFTSRLAVLVVALALPLRAVGAELAVTYLVDAMEFNRNVEAGAVLTFELHSTRTCSSAIDIEQKEAGTAELLVEVTKFRKVKKQPGRPPSGLRLHSVMTAEVSGQVFLKVLGDGVIGLPVSCQSQMLAGPDPNAPRFEDCGDGTVADHQTGLQWEKKTGTLGSLVFCDTTPCPDPHDVNNLYPWSLTGTEPDGAAFTDFLARLNGDPTVVAAIGTEAFGDPAADPTVCFAHHCDWHLPAIGELRTILIGPHGAPGQATTCPPPKPSPCIDPGFVAVGGPTASSFYWSASTFAGFPTSA